MQELGKIYALILLGACFVFFVKGVWEVNTTPANFQFGHFISENLNRIWLLIFGLIVTGLILFLEPGGLPELFAQLPIQVQLGSPLLVGAGLSGITLMMPRKSA